MPTEADPIPGEWYVNEDDGQRFQVQGLDRTQDVVEIMHYNGNLEELPLQRWYELSVVPGEQPMNAGAPMADEEPIPELEYPVSDPVSAKIPSEDEVYRRRNVEYANKAEEGYPGEKSESDEEGWGRDQSIPDARRRGEQRED